VAHITLASIFSNIFMTLEVLRRRERFAIPDASSWIDLLVLGLGCHALGWWLIIHGMPKIPLSAVGLSILLQPTGAFIWDMLLFHRPTSIFEGIGAALALRAIYLGTTSKRSAPGHQSGLNPIKVKRHPD
jgi:drug/metabolite transporter (DMT)-like permease